MRVVVAPDKFRGSLSADEVADALARGVRTAGGVPLPVPVSDGGEGFLEVMGGANRSTVVTGPLGDEVRAAWRLSGREAVIEAAQACGLALAGGAEGNDPVGAATPGVGELIAEAVDSGARTVFVGVGGTASTDGGWGAVGVLGQMARLHGVRIVVACDVTTPFEAAAEDFGPQKGASPAQVELLRRRLARLRGIYGETYGVDVSALPGAGAAGGLAGGLAALGAELIPGFDLVAEHTGLFEKLEGAGLVITGEGHLDAESFHGKVVGGVLEAAGGEGVAAAVIVGSAEPAPEVRLRVGGAELIDLTERFGEDSWTRTAECLAEAAAEVTARHLKGVRTGLTPGQAPTR